jgi:methyl-accepting chemotaxis protein
MMHGLRYIRSLSVRTRIAVLALIPVVGILGIGITYLSAERDAEAALDSVRSSAALAAASLNFKLALATMQASARDMAVRPTEEVIKTFQGANDLASSSLEAIRASARSDELSDINALQEHLSPLKPTFDKLVQEQQTFGFTDLDGIRGRAGNAGIAVDRLIASGLTGIPEVEARALMLSLTVMRRLDAEFRLSGKQVSHWKFIDEYKKVNRVVEKLPITPEAKAEFAAPVKAYADALAGWIESSNKVAYLSPIISEQCKVMLTPADRLIAIAGERASQASAALAGSQADNKNIILAVGGGVTAIGLILSFLVGRGITAPLHRLTSAMGRLAEGDFDVALPGLGRTDEIGEMASAVDGFKVKAVERARLEAEHEEVKTRAAAAARAAEMHKLADSFEAAIGNVVETVSRSAVDLEAAASVLTKSATTTEQISASVAEASMEASRNVHSVASAAEELATSVREVGAQVEDIEPNCRRSGQAGRLDGCPDPRIVEGGRPHRRSRQPHHGNRRADQPARLERHDRGGPRRNRRQGFRHRCRRGEKPRQPDRAGDRRDRNPDRRHADGQR